MIAIRALRAAKELGYQVASVYSTVDKDQKHLKLSDEAICKILQSADIASVTRQMWYRGINFRKSA